MKQILILFFVFFLAISLVNAATLTLKPSIIYVNIFSGENKTVLMTLTSTDTGNVHMHSNITKNTSDLEGFGMIYPEAFKIEKNHPITIPVSIWLDERFGPNNVTIKFWAVEYVSSGNGGGGGGINITTEEHKNNETIPPKIPANQTNQTQPPVKPIEKINPWWKEPWYWFWIALFIIIIALTIWYIIWKRKQEVEAELEEEQVKGGLKKK